MTTIVVVVESEIAESRSVVEAGRDDTDEKEERDGEDKMWGNLVLRFTDISISELQETVDLFHPV